MEEQEEQEQEGGVESAGTAKLYAEHEIVFRTLCIGFCIPNVQEIS